MLQKYNVLENNRYASLVILFCFILGLALSDFFLSVWGWSEYLVSRFLLAISILPLFYFAYVQNHMVGYSDYVVDKNRIFYKSVIFVLQYIAILLSARFFSGFSEGFYQNFINDAWLFLPFFLVLTPLYIYWVEKKIPQASQDEYAQIYLMVKGKYLDKFVLRKFMFKFLLKIIFIPYMYSGVLNNLLYLIHTPIVMNSEKIGLLLFNLGLTFDMLIAVFGYLFSSSLINNQLKEIDDNIISWTFALLCYPPLYSITEYINQQQDVLIWSDIIPKDTVWYWLFFVVLNTLWVVYWLSTIEFGMTFSNLSYRRLINTGVYRYTKHPAYLSKNLYWWLYTLPFFGVAFFSVDWWKNILGLLFLSLLYYGRAMSEEKFLKSFPEYQQYCEKIETSGLFSKINISKKCFN